MSGKWTERGIECEHEPSHLVADENGVVVCNKRKPRQKIPVGKMMVQTLFPRGKRLSAKTPVGETLLDKLQPMGFFPLMTCPIYPELTEHVLDLEEANAAIHNAEAYAKEMLKKLSARFREVIYAKGLAAPTTDALHEPPFGCPRHPKSRFFWKPQKGIQDKFPTLFYRECLECSLNPKSLNEPVEGGTPHNAYQCEHCGIVLGNTETRNVAHDLKEYTCKLCGTKVGEFVSSR